MPVFSITFILPILPIDLSLKIYDPAIMEQERAVVDAFVSEKAQ